MTETTSPKVYSKRKGAVLVDRSTPYGNPYHMVSERSAFGGRDAACNKFERYALKRLEQEPGWLEPLRGKDLVCWCKPTPDSPIRCHADTLLRLANQDRTGQDLTDHSHTKGGE